jgi:hypothetical protein
MDATARGFHAQLMLIAAQQAPAGVLPDDDALWRRWVGLPEATVAATVSRRRSPDAAAKALLEESLRTGHALGVPDSLVLALHPQAHDWREGQGSWLDHLWRTRWKPMLAMAWPTVTAGLVQAHPMLAGHEGQRYCAMAAAMGQTAAPSAEGSGTALPPTNVVAFPARPAAGSGSALGTAVAPDARPAKRRRAVGKRDPVLLALLAITPHTDPLHDTAQVLRCFQATPLPEQRSSIWDLGLNLLAASPEERRGARAYLGRLIRDYGETPVFQAVAEAAVKAVPPVEAKAYLTGVLKRQSLGSESEQKAREQRLRVLV